MKFESHIILKKNFPIFRDFESQYSYKLILLLIPMKPNCKQQVDDQFIMLSLP